MWRPRWHKFGTKPVGRLEEAGMNFSLACIVNMNQIGLLRFDNEHLYCESIEGQFSSLYFLLKNIGTYNQASSLHM